MLVVGRHSPPCSLIEDEWHLLACAEVRRRVVPSGSKAAHPGSGQLRPQFSLTLSDPTFTSLHTAFTLRGGKLASCPRQSLLDCSPPRRRPKVLNWLFQAPPKFAPQLTLPATPCSQEAAPPRCSALSGLTLLHLLKIQPLVLSLSLPRRPAPLLWAPSSPHFSLPYAVPCSMVISSHVVTPRPLLPCTHSWSSTRADF